MRKMLFQNHILPFSQVSPPNVEVHEHLKRPTLSLSSLQVPPFLHGFIWQGLEAENNQKYDTALFTTKCA